MDDGLAGRVQAALDAVHTALAATDEADRLLDTLSIPGGRSALLGGAIQQLHLARRALEAAEGDVAEGNALLT